ncbi:MAG: Ig-like domain-containing protein [Ignavibacteriales bacterium]|nr:Ig-like domain-containing protein [Ignavibacteriales bacterium]
MKKSKNSMVVVKLYLIVLLFSMTLLFLSGCANQLPPGGGEVDKIPPGIIYSYPENGTTNFDDDYIEFEFSEYVDKRSFKDALFISPALDEQPEISWSGTSVEIGFPDGLKDSITYVITIGTDVVDVNNKNRMENSFSFSFATGDKIDTRTIAGKVYGNEIEGSLIFAYKYSEDTTKYLSKKPDYLSQIGKDGSYKLNGLAESEYLVFAVKDQFRDYLYQADQDLIGIASKSISLTGIDSTYSGLDFFMMKVDTIPPRLLTTVMTDENHIIITLSEECDSASYLADNFQIIDSTSNSTLPLAFSYHNKSKKAEFVLVNKNKLIADNTYYLLAKKIRDLEGNVFENELSNFVISDKPDTTVPKLLRTDPNRNGSIDFKDPKILLFFDDAIDNSALKSSIELMDTSKNKIGFTVTRIDDATISINPDLDLKPEKNFEVVINFNDFQDAAGNKVDSFYTLKFQTITGIEFTGISGKVNSTNNNIVVVLQDPKDPKKFYTAVPDKTMAYSFERINAGVYSMWLYSDTDRSNTFDYGYPEPLRKSEDFYVVPDTIKLRPRWGVTDYNIEFK